MKVKSKNIVMISVLITAAFFAIAFSYYSILRIKSNLKASLICKNNKAFLKIINHGDATKLFYVSVTEGDKILYVKKLGSTLKQRDSLLVNLSIPNEEVKVSILLERGVISELKCGFTKTSEP